MEPNLAAKKPFRTLAKKDESYILIFLGLNIGKEKNLRIPL